MLDHVIEDTLDAKARGHLAKYPLAALQSVARLYREIVALDPDGTGPFADVDRAYLADVEAAIAQHGV